MMSFSWRRSGLLPLLLVALLAGPWSSASFQQGRVSSAMTESDTIEGQSPVSLAEDVAKTAVRIWNETGPGKEKWNYERGVLLVGFQNLYLARGGDEFLGFVQRKTDRWVEDNGTISTYNLTEYTLDNILSGRNLLFLWKETRLEKYRVAIEYLRSQLLTHPRTNQGGFWHKLVYPYQMWLDGLYMAEPFYAEYATTFDEPDDFDDIAKQFLLAAEHMKDPVTGLFYHGYDESRAQNWSNPITGDSESFWGRGDGWYAMALVDTLDFFPIHHPQRPALLAILSGLVAAIEKVQDPASGVWWEVLDKGGKEGNYLESSASAMFVYTISKAARLGYVHHRYHKVAKKAYEGVVKHFVHPGSSDGGLNFTRTVSVGGLGGTPYRNGSYAYYLSEAVVTNDPKGIGPFLMASVEIENTCKDC